MKIVRQNHLRESQFVIAGKVAIKEQTETASEISMKEIELYANSFATDGTFPLSIAVFAI